MEMGWNRKSLRKWLFTGSDMIKMVKFPSPTGFSVLTPDYEGVINLASCLFEQRRGDFLPHPATGPC